MAVRKFFADINLNQNELVSAVLETTTPPAALDSVTGQIIYDTASGVPKYFDGAAWVSMSSAAASSVPFDGVQSGINTGQNLTLGSGSTFLVNGGTLQLNGSSSGIMTIATNLAGTTNRTISFPNIGANSVLLAASDTPAANQFVVASGSTPGLVEYRTISQSDIQNIIDLPDLNDVSNTVGSRGEILYYFDDGVITEWRGSALTSTTTGSVLTWDDAADTWESTSPSDFALILDSLISHNNLSGLTTGDPHTQYIAKNVGTSDSRNIITGSQNSDLFKIIGSAPSSGQTVSFFRVSQGASTWLDLRSSSSAAGDSILPSSGIFFDTQSVFNSSLFVDGLNNTGTHLALLQSEIRYYDQEWDNLAFPPAAPNYVALASPSSILSTITLRLPNSVGSNGQFLQTDGSGNMSWATPVSNLGGLSDVSITTPATPSYLKYDGSEWIDVGVGAVADDIQSSIDHNLLANLTSGDPHSQYLVTDVGSSSTRNIITADDATRDILIVDAPFPVTPSNSDHFAVRSGGDPIFQVGVSGPVIRARFNTATRFDMIVDLNANLNVNGGNEIRFIETGTGGNFIGFSAPVSIATDINYTLPNADGSNGQFLQTNGSGVLSWGSASTSLAGLTDTNITSPTNPSYLQYNGSQWVDVQSIPTGHIANFDEEVESVMATVLVTNASHAAISVSHDNANDAIDIMLDADLVDLNNVFEPVAANGGDVLTYDVNAGGAGIPGWRPLAPGSFGGAIDHNTLQNLVVGDFHTQYIYNAPGSSARNVITPSGDFVPLILRKGTGASDVFVIQTNDGTGELFVFDTNSVIYTAGDQVFFNHADGASGGYVKVTRSSTGVAGYIDISTSGAGQGGRFIATTNSALEAGFVDLHSNDDSRGGNIDLGAAAGVSTERAGQWTGTAGLTGRGGDLIMDGSAADAGDIDTSGGSANGEGGSILTYGGMAASGTPVLRGGNIWTFGSNSIAGTTRGGDILTNSVAASGFRGGDIITQSGSGGAGGDLNMSGGASAAGGSITTSNGGGSINTNTGVIGLGISGSRLTIQKSVTADRTVTFINQTGSVPVFSSAPASTDLFVLSANTTGGIKFATRNIEDLTNVNSGATNGQVLQYNGSAWNPVNSNTIGVTDHGNLTGLSDDDHSQYIIDSPTDLRSNSITGDNGQTALLELTQGPGGVYSGGDGDTIFIVRSTGEEHYFRIQSLSNTSLRADFDFSEVTFLNETAIIFKSDNSAGSNGVALKAASTISNDYTITLPGSSPATNQILYNTGSGTLAWGSHNNMAGLTAGDPHTQYVALSPALSSRNLITAQNVSTTPLIARAASPSQSADIFQVQKFVGATPTNVFSIAASGNATFSENLTITGDLVVNGTTTTINTTNLVIEDNYVVVNSLGTAQDAGIEVQTARVSNAFIYFDESETNWYVDNSDGVNLQIARKFVSTITGDGVDTSFAITHGMNTQDVVVAVYDPSYEQVEVEVDSTSATQVTLNFNSPVPNSDVYTIVIVG